MKKYNLFKTILITLFIFALLSWFIKGGLIYNGEYYKADTSTALGIGDIISLPYQSFYLFAEYGLIFILIGGMYGVFNETGVYKRVVDNFASKFANKKVLFIILTSIFFLTIESIMGSAAFSFVFVPFFASVLFKLGFNKYKTMLATVGSIILATFASLIGLGSVINYLLGINSLSLIKVRCLLFLITIVIIGVTFILKEKKPDSKEENVNKLEPTLETTKSSFPLIAIFLLFIAIAGIGLYNWSECLNIKTFANISNNVLANIKILNGFSSLGNWGTKELAIMIIIIILVTGLAYKIKIKDLIEAFKTGAKPMLKVAFYTTLCSLIFMYYYNSKNGYNFIDTLVYKIFGGSNDSLVFKTALATPVENVLLNNPIFLANSLTTYLKTLSTNSSTLASAALAMQMTTGLAMMVLPTSYILIAGLSYFEIDYSKWLKFIAKIFLVLILVTGIIVTI